jgi:LAO/AO transport system kinase
MLRSLVERFRAGDRLALSRLLTLAARGEHLEAELSVLPAATKPSRVIAITGSAGVGKSSLVGKSIEWLRAQGLTVAVLACDPQSPLTGGALLGDRFRMPDLTDDAGVFIRSLAAPSGHGAIAAHLDMMIVLLERFGFDVILVETVGAGQGDTIIHELVDAVVVLLQPEMGDDLQWEKAGLLEVADVVVVHKADLPGAELVEAQARSMLGLSTGAHAPVLRVSAKTGQGLEELWQTVIHAPLRRRPPHLESGEALLHLAQAGLAQWFAAAQADGDPDLQRLIAQWQQGQIETDEAALALVQLLQREHGFVRERQPH